MPDLWTLRDNYRDDQGEPWETTGTPAELAAYIVGPLLSDHPDPFEYKESLDDLR